MEGKSKAVIALAIGLVVLIVTTGLLHYWENAKAQREAFDDAAPFVEGGKQTTAREVQLRLGPNPPSGTTVKWHIGNETGSGGIWDVGRLPEGDYSYSVNLTHSKYGSRDLTGSFEVEYQPRIIFTPTDALYGDRVAATLDLWGSAGNATVESFVVDGEGVNGTEFSRVVTLSRTVAANATVVLDDGRTFELREESIVRGKAVIRASDFSVEVGATVRFSVDVMGMPLGYDVQWTTGGGDKQSGPTASWRFPSAGTYKVHVTVTGENGALAEDDTTVTVKASPPPPKPAEAKPPATPPASSPTLCHDHTAVDALQEGRRDRQYKDAGVAFGPETHRYVQRLATDKPSTGTLQITWYEGSTQQSRNLCHAIFPGLESRVFYDHQDQRERTFVDVRIVTHNFVEMCQYTPGGGDCPHYTRFMYFPDDADHFWVAGKIINYPRPQS